MTRQQTDCLSLLGRVLLSLIFIQGGFNKLIGPADGQIQYIASHGLPFPQLAYYVSILVELGGGLAILAGVQTTLVALAMAAFCLVTAAFFHYVPGDRGQMINFWKNIAIAGGFLQLAAMGGGMWSVDGWLARRRG